jgi:hypothetical protein
MEVAGHDAVDFTGLRIGDAKREIADVLYGAVTV